MADHAPRKTGLYERPMGGKGLIIGLVVLLALIVLAIIFFSNRPAGAATLEAGQGYAVTAPSRSGQPEGLGRTGPPPCHDRTYGRVRQESGAPYPVPAAVRLPQ